MTFSELLESSGMSMREFSERFGIPYRTCQNWKLGERPCPEYIIKMISEILGIG